MYNEQNNGELYLRVFHNSAPLQSLTPHQTDEGFENLFYSPEMDSWFKGVEITHNSDLLTFDYAQGEEVNLCIHVPTLEI